MQNEAQGVNGINATGGWGLFMPDYSLNVVTHSLPPHHIIKSYTPSVRSRLVHYIRDWYSINMKILMNDNRPNSVGAARATRAGAEGEKPELGSRR
jgi:hypothetical protein